MDSTTLIGVGVVLAVLSGMAGKGLRLIGFACILLGVVQTLGYI